MKKATGTSMKSKEPTIIRLTKIKQWYVVADVETYKVLKDLGTPMIRVHQNFLPTLGLLTSRANVKVKNVDFESEIMDPFLTKTTETWAKKYGKVQMTNRNLVFSAASTSKDGPGADAKFKGAKSAVEKLETILATFFARWGYKCQLVYSENKDGTKMKFHVEYWFDSEKTPILPLETPVQELKHVELKFGFARLVLSMDDMTKKGRNQNYIHVRFEVSQGGNWTSVHTSKCLPTQVSSVLPAVGAMMEIVNLDPHNFDNEAS